MVSFVGRMGEHASTHPMTCHDGHPEISHGEAHCPLCDALTEVGMLRLVLKDALDEWAFCAGYKGDALMTKHKDRERIAALREMCA